MSLGWHKYPLVANTDHLVTPEHVTHERSGDDAASPAAINVEATAADLSVQVALPS